VSDRSDESRSTLNLNRSLCKTNLLQQTVSFNRRYKIYVTFKNDLKLDYESRSNQIDCSDVSSQLIDLQTYKV
jgi:hypothetical protein